MIVYNVMDIIALAVVGIILIVWIVAILIEKLIKWFKE